MQAIGCKFKHLKEIIAVNGFLGLRGIELQVWVRLIINNCQLLTDHGRRSYRAGMNVNLGGALDSFVADLLKTGLYQSQSEVVREGLRLLKEREELKNFRLAELRKEIAIGSEQADRGEFVDGEEAFAEIRRRSAGRKRVTG